MTLTLEIMLGIAALIFASRFNIIINNIKYEMGK